MIDIGHAGAWMVVAAGAAAASASVDPVVAVAVVTAVAGVAVAFINGRVARANANIASLRLEAKDAHDRADRAQARAEAAADRLVDLEDRFHQVMRKFTILEIWSQRVSAEMRTHGLTPPPLPE